MIPDVYLTTEDLRRAAALAAAAGDIFRERSLRDIAEALPDRSRGSMLVTDHVTGELLPEGDDALLRVAAGTASIWGVRHTVEDEPVLVLSGGAYV